MKTKRFLGTLAIAVIAAVAAVWAYSQFFQPDQQVANVTGQQSMLYTQIYPVHPMPTKVRWISLSRLKKQSMLLCM